jgi:hypothetical protein
MLATRTSSASWWTARQAVSWIPWHSSNGNGLSKARRRSGRPGWHVLTALLHPATGPLKPSRRRRPPCRACRMPSQVRLALGAAPG